MSADEHFRKLENMYHAAPCNQTDRPRLSITEGKATLTMDVRPQNFHAADALHGAFYFKMLDDAAYFAVSSLLRDTLVLTVSFNVYLVRPVSEGTLRSEASVISTTKSLSVGEATLYNGDDVVIARGSGSFMASSFRLDKLEGYR